MKDLRIGVAAYAGYRGEELPRSLRIDGSTIEVSEVEKLWIEEDRATRRKKRFFRVKGNNSRTYILYYDEESMDWFLHQKKSRLTSRQ